MLIMLGEYDMDNKKIYEIKSDTNNIYGEEPEKKKKPRKKLININIEPEKMEKIKKVGITLIGMIVTA